MIYIFFTCLEIYPLYENYNSVIDFVIQVCIGTLNMTYLCFCHFENNHSSSFIFHTFLSVHPSQQKPVHADRCTMPVCCRHVIIDFRYWKKEADGLVERQKTQFFSFQYTDIIPYYEDSLHINSLSDKFTWNVNGLRSYRLCVTY